MLFDGNVGVVMLTMVLGVVVLSVALILEERSGYVLSDSIFVNG